MQKYFLSLKALLKQQPLVNSQRGGCFHPNKGIPRTSVITGSVITNVYFEYHEVIPDRVPDESS